VPSFVEFRFADDLATTAATTPALNSYLPVLARLLMCSLFIWDGVLQLRNPAATVDYFTSLKLSCSDWQTDRRLAVVDLTRFFPATDGRIDCCRLLIDDYHSAANRRASLACVTFPEISDVRMGLSINFGLACSKT
jgi:hypothetical protein